MSAGLLRRLYRLYRTLRVRLWTRHRRHVALGDLVADRWNTARFLGFGAGASWYDNVLILADVKGGANTWIGPNVVLDRRGVCALSGVAIRS